MLKVVPIVISERQAQQEQQHLDEQLESMGIDRPPQSDILKSVQTRRMQIDLRDIAQLAENEIPSEQGVVPVTSINMYNGESFLTTYNFEKLSKLRKKSWNMYHKTNVE